MDARLNEAIERGLGFLAAWQLPSGQFPIEVTFHYKEGSPVEPDLSLFATTHIAYSLGFLPHPQAQEMIARALRYFQSEQTGQGLWRFWNKAARWGNIRLCPFIPADLDDMANVSWLLRRHNVPFPDNRRLMLLNRNRSGRFHTWLMWRPVPTLRPIYWRTMLTEFTLPRYTVFWKGTEASYNDIDGVVNANVLFYLGDCPETQPVIAWLREIVETGQEATCDKWYREPWPFYYALSRAAHAGIGGLASTRETVLAALARAANTSGQIGENLLHTALAANTLLNFDDRSRLLDRAIAYLLENQAENGSWPSAPYYYGGPKKATSWGSEELTTGLCLEALYRYTVAKRSDSREMAESR